VLAQEFDDWEMLISDDGSTDGSRAYLDELDDPRINVFRQETNLGIFGNLNFLFAQASGPISQLLCQDDWFTDPHSLDAIVERWASVPPETGFIRTNWNAEALLEGDAPTANNLRAVALETLPSTITPQAAPLYFFLFGCVPGNLSNVSLRTSLVDEVGAFDQRLPFAGDFDFWVRASRTRPFILDRRLLVVVRTHSGQASTHLNRKGELVEQLFTVVEGLYSCLSGEGSRWTLRLFATLVYDSGQRYAALRRMQSPDGRQYMRSLEHSARAHPMIFGLVGRWLVFGASLGGRLLRARVARRLLARTQRGYRTR
jgi:glycosyltransferase involved in cell wall biosynthesis